MPSQLHEAMVEMLRSHPDLVARLLREAGLPGLGWYDQIVSDSADLGAVVPLELAADCVLRVVRGGRTELVVVVEVQLAIDARKSFAWPAYVVGARTRHRCDVVLLVVTPSDSVASWARRPISLGPNTGSVQAQVIGPREMPIIVEEEAARASPELAVLAAIAHGQDSDIGLVKAIATAAYAAAFTLPDERAQVYYDLIWAALSEAAREALQMIPQNYEYQHEGLRRAKAEGKEEGKAEEASLALLGVLEARGLVTTAAQRATILSCTDVEQLRAWLVAAVSAPSVDAVVG